MHLIDFETSSRCNLRTEGLGRYCRHESTRPLCLGYILDRETEPRLWLPGHPQPEELFDGTAIAAFNAGFEESIWVHTLKWPVVQWYCIAARARFCGLPGSLKNLSEWFALGDEGKDKEGAKLIDQLCKPISTGKRKGEFRTEQEFPELFQALYRYCLQDCRAEKTILERLPKWPDQEYAIWQMTAKQNQSGCPIDIQLCKSVVALTDQFLARAKETISTATNGQIVSPTQTTALKKWLNEQNVNVDNVGKETISKLLEDKTLPPNIKAVLKARQVGAPAAIRKFKTALAQEVDGRIRNWAMYAGAGATARFSSTSAESTGTQLQNLFRGEQSEYMLDLIKLQDADLLTAVCEATGDSPIGELQKSTRAMLCAGDSNTFVYTDLNAIEPRMARWLTNAPSLNIFRRLDAMTDPAEKKRSDFYRQAAVATLKKAIDQITETDRQMFKVLELSGQYGCGWLKLQMTVDMWTRGKIKLNDAQAQAAIKVWRTGNPEIVQGWSRLEKAFRMVLTGERSSVTACKCTFTMPYPSTIACTLPSGRPMYYNKCKIVDKEIQCTKHDGMPIKIYGGHLLENVTQAASRDILAEKMLECERAGIGICQHAHDQILHECSEADAPGRAEIVERIMTAAPTWAKDLPLSSPVKLTKRMI